MLFSHPEVARVLNERFECAWEMVRPVPKVHVDFGDGRTLDRTLLGNIATYVTLADGRVIDVVPGLVDPVEYQRRLDQALRLHAMLAPWLAVRGPDVLGEPARVGPAAEPTVVERLLRSYHGDAEAWDAADRATRVAELQQAQMRADLSKIRVEDPVKDALRRLHLERLRDDRVYEPPDDGGPEDVLLADTAYNVRVRYPQVRALLAARPPATPAELTETLYRDVLGVDLADPYLGLAPYVLGGEVGRH